MTVQYKCTVRLLLLVATLCDVTVVASRAMDRLGRDFAIDVMISIIAYADDVLAIVVADSEAKVQIAVDIIMSEFVAYFSSCGLAMNPDKSELIVFRKGRQVQELQVGGQVEATKTKLLGVTVEKGYTFEAHATQVSATMRSKAEKLSNVVKFLDLKKRTRVTEAIVVSTVSYCMAVWGFRQKWRFKCQKSLNVAMRMILNLTSRDSMTEAMTTLGWLNADNLWRLEQVTALRRICSTHVPEIIHQILTKNTNRRYLIRSDGLQSSWWPRNTHGENAFVNTSVEVYNQLRIGQRAWFNTLERRMLTKSEVRNEIKGDLVKHYGNINLY